MKIKVNTEKFNDALSNVSRAIKKNAVIPALEGVLLEAKDNEVRITGYNLEIGIIQSIEADVKEEGNVVLSADVLSRYVKKAPAEDLEINTNKKTTTVKSGKSKISLVGMTKTEYPDLPQLDDVKNISLDAEDFSDGVNTVIYAAADKHTNVIYTGVLCEFEEKTLNMVGIDGYRMAVKNISIEDNGLKESIVIPKIALNEVLKAQKEFKDEEKMELLLSARHLAFKIGDITIISRLLEGEFLDYKGTIPKSKKTTITIDTDTIGGANDRLGILTTSEGKITSPIRVDVTDKIVMTVTSATGKAEEEISPLECVIDGEPVEIGFNQRYLAEALKAVSSENINISLNGALSPAIITCNSDDNNELHLVVPMRLSAK